MASDIDNQLTGLQWAVGGAVGGGAIGLGTDIYTNGSGADMPIGAAGGGAAGYALGSGAVGTFIVVITVILLVAVVVIMIQSRADNTEQTDDDAILM